jgi:hypothetical protein
VPLCASIASGSTECAPEELGGRSASILDEDENAFFQDPLEAFSGSGEVCAGEVIRAAFEHEARDLMAAYQVVVKLVVKLVVDVRGGDVVQAAVEHETRDIYLYNIHTHTYIYIYMCVCICIRV